MPPVRNLAVAHGTEQNSKAFWRGEVDVLDVGEIGNQGARQELVAASPGLTVLSQRFHAGQVGRRQIGRAGRGGERQTRQSCHGRGKGPFSQPRPSFQKQMPAGEQGNQRVLDDLGGQNKFFRQGFAEFVEEPAAVGGGRGQFGIWFRPDHGSGAPTGERGKHALEVLIDQLFMLHNRPGGGKWPASTVLLASGNLSLSGRYDVW